MEGRKEGSVRGKRRKGYTGKILYKYKSERYVNWRGDK